MSVLELHTFKDFNMDKSSKDACSAVLCRQAQLIFVWLLLLSPVPVPLVTALH